MKKRYSENDLKKIVENYRNGEFILLSIIENKGLKSKILVKHKKCNRELEIILYNLVNLNYIGLIIKNLMKKS